MEKLIKINHTDGSLLFSHKCENNTIKKTLELAVSLGVDVGGADLRGADLRGINLKYADLRVADLRCADLRDSDLRFANLTCANVIGADFGGADLRGADIYCIKVTQKTYGGNKRYELIQCFRDADIRGVRSKYDDIY
jgi:uncharacterized protein YjbI with pentapeptide repeats